VLGGALWMSISIFVLNQTGSELPRTVLKRLRLA